MDELSNKRFCLNLRAGFRFQRNSKYVIVLFDIMSFHVCRVYFMSSCLVNNISVYNISSYDVGTCCINLKYISKPLYYV